MSKVRPSSRPWQAWLAIVAGVYCCYLLYGQFLSLRVYLRPDIITTTGQLLEDLLRLSGIFILACAALLARLRRPYALGVAILGALGHLLPWLYGYASSVIAQPQPHLKSHMLRVYPVLSWQWLVVPCLTVLLVYLAVRADHVNGSEGGE